VSGIRQRLKALEKQAAQTTSAAPCNILRYRTLPDGGVEITDCPSGTGPVVMLEWPATTIDEWLEYVKRAEADAVGWELPEA
jgi:hypothetical protein